jgi:hypothetical protein
LSKYIVNVSCESAVFETDAGRLLPLVDHEVALSSQSDGPPPQRRGAARRGTSKPTDKAPSCGCCEWMRLANVSRTLQNVPMRCASIRSDHVRVAEQSRYYAERRCCCKSGQRTHHFSGLCFLPSPTSQSQTQQNAFRRLHYSHS